MCRKGGELGLGGRGIGCVGRAGNWVCRKGGELAV